MNRRLTAVIAATLLLTSPAIALANPAWTKEHPRRAEVNHRLHTQSHRIRHERRDGEISGAQAHQLHRQDHQIRREEHIMASQNGGHVTPQEQRTLNQQENQVSHEIGR